MLPVTVTQWIPLVDEDLINVDNQSRASREVTVEGESTLVVWEGRQEFNGILLLLV